MCRTAGVALQDMTFLTDIDPLILLNAVLFGWALFESVRRVKRTNTRRWLRVPAAFLAGYIFIVYLSAIVGIIPDAEIRFYMRWLQLVIAGYIVAEAKHG